MKLKIDENSTNYPCSVVRIGKVNSIQGADRIKRTVIIGNEIIISSEVKEGDIMLYFVAGTQMSPEICAYNNLYVEAEMNADKTKKQYLSPKKRLVKAIKLRGSISDGLLLPLESLNYLEEGKLDAKSFLKEGDSFTHLGDVEVCKKYVVERKVVERLPGEKKPKTTKLKDKLIENQFRFHSETAHFARNLEKFEPSTEFVVTRKYHGSSGILSNVLINKKLNWFEKLINRFVKLPQSEYGFVVSSGKPKSRLPKSIKTNSIDWKSPTPNFYSNNIWEKAYQLHIDKVEKGITLYFEIVGNGIQGAEYTYGFDYEIFIYRITQTNPDGNVYELSWEAVKRYCEKYGLKYVDELFVGKMSDVVGINGTADDLLQRFKYVYLDKSYKDCSIDEGVVIRNRKTDELLKLKSPKFLLKETDDLDKGIESETR